MKGNFIIRADFYSCGNVIPLGITDENGNTLYIEKIIETKYTNHNELRIKCLAEKNIYILTLKNNHWFLSDE